MTEREGRSRIAPRPTMNDDDITSVPCAICGAEHDPTGFDDVDSMHLCATCASFEELVRNPRAPTTPDAKAAPATRRP